MGVVDFPPFYTIQQNQPLSGLGIDLINAMNEIQSDYRFEVVEASPRRRHDMFKKGLYDISLFDHLSWGWTPEDVMVTRVFLRGGERYITARNKEVAPTLFKDISSRKIGAILGYHYNFANFETDPEKLKKRFDINLVTYQEQIIKQVLSHRVEIGVITETFLKKYLKENIEVRDRIVISENYDQEYNFVGIVRKEAAITATELENIILSVINSPKYQWIADEYGIKWQN
nr:transporter substrate-binding domain-containing protein [Kiloniella litopenaei]